MSDLHNLTFSPLLFISPYQCYQKSTLTPTEPGTLPSMLLLSSAVI